MSSKKIYKSNDLVNFTPNPEQQHALNRGPTIKATTKPFVHKDEHVALLDEAAKHTCVERALTNNVRHDVPCEQCAK